MSKEELIQFIKDNLTIKVDIRYPYNDTEGLVKVSLELNGEVISESSDCINT